MISDDIVLCVSVVVIVLFGSCRANSAIHVTVPTERDKLMYNLANLQNITLSYMKSPNKFVIEEDMVNQSDDQLKFLLEYDIKNLRCTYLLNVLHHMRLTRNLLAHSQENWTETIGLISVYKDDVAPKMIETLFELGVRDLNLLWMFYLYVDGLSAVLPTDPVITSITSTRYGRDVPNISLIHNAVIVELRKHTTSHDCTTNSVYMLDSENYKFNDCDGKDKNKREACTNRVKTLVKENFNSFRDSMKQNEKYGVVAYKNPSFDINRLYLNNAVKSAEFMNELMDTFDVQIDWRSVPGELVELNTNAHDLNELKEKTWTAVRLYQTAFYSFLKLFVIRMTRKHLKYQKYYDSYGIFWTDGNQEKYNKYTSDIKTILEKFIHLFKLSNNDELRDVLNAIEQKAFKYQLRGRLQDILNIAKKKERSLLNQFRDKLLVKPLSTSSRKLVTFDMETFVKKHKITIDSPCPGPKTQIRPIALNLLKMEILYHYLLGNKELKYINFEVIAAFMSSRQ